MIDVYIVSGFLGAGKTSFIQYLLEKHDFKKIMLIENEFGEVGVDASFFNNSLQIKEINNGCICCSMKGDFKKALEEVKTYDIDTLLIEPSGVGKLMDIMGILVRDPAFRLLSHVCVVNVNTAKKYHKNFKEFFDDQVIGANTIVLTHLDQTTHEKKMDALKIIDLLNDEADLIDRPYEEYEISELLDLMLKNVCNCPECVHMHDEECDCMHHHHGHHHHHHGDEIFDAIAFYPKKVFTRAMLEDLFSKMDENIIRVKGYVQSADETLYFNYILNEYKIFAGEMKEGNVISFIGTDLDCKLLEGMINQL